MKKLIQIEEAGLFILSLFLYSRLGFGWWLFAILFFLPDLSMIGYTLNAKAGAIIYNLFHHRFVGIGIYLTGYYLEIPIVSLTGVILFSHSTLDRIFGYGLKKYSGFKHTHLGEIG